MRALAKLVALNKPDLCLFVGEAHSASVPAERPKQ
jgi:hypothetical protein